jgi:hypothetical protein
LSLTLVVAALSMVGLKPQRLTSPPAAIALPAKLGKDVGSKRWTVFHALIPKMGGELRFNQFVVFPAGQSRPAFLGIRAGTGELIYARYDITGSQLSKTWELQTNAPKHRVNKRFPVYDSTIQKITGNRKLANADIAASINYAVYQNAMQRDMSSPAISLAVVARDGTTQCATADREWRSGDAFLPITDFEVLLTSGFKKRLQKIGTERQNNFNLAMSQLKRTSMYKRMRLINALFPWGRADTLYVMFFDKSNNTRWLVGYRRSGKGVKEEWRLHFNVTRTRDEPAQNGPLGKHLWGIDEGSATNARAVRKALSSTQQLSEYALNESGAIFLSAYIDETGKQRFDSMVGDQVSGGLAPCSAEFRYLKSHHLLKDP